MWNWRMGRIVCKELAIAGVHSMLWRYSLYFHDHQSLWRYFGQKPSNIVDLQYISLEM
jgi:hypothetical protein